MSREPRYKVEIQVDCSTKDLFLANRVTNISRGGVFIETQLPYDSEVDLQFRLEGPEVTIRAKGRVVWNYDMKHGSLHVVVGSGIRFTEMDPGQRALLHAYLDHLRASPGAQGVSPSP